MCGVLLILLIKCGIFHALLCSYGEMENEIITVWLNIAVHICNQFSSFLSSEERITDLVVNFVMCYVKVQTALQF